MAFLFLRERWPFQHLDSLMIIGRLQGLRFLWEYNVSAANVKGRL